MRAERRLGELIAAQKAGPGLHEGGRPRKTGVASEPVMRPTLADADIDKKLSSGAPSTTTLRRRAIRRIA